MITDTIYLYFYHQQFNYDDLEGFRVYAPTMWESLWNKKIIDFLCGLHWAPSHLVIASNAILGLQDSSGRGRVRSS